jgi:hypothetical protein
MGGCYIEWQTGTHYMPIVLAACSTIHHATLLEASQPPLNARPGIRPCAGGGNILKRPIAKERLFRGDGSIE